MTYQTLLTLGKSKNHLYFIYPYQFLENSLTVLYDGRYVSVFGMN